MDLYKITGAYLPEQVGPFPLKPTKHVHVIWFTEFMTGSIQYALSSHGFASLLQRLNPICSNNLKCYDELKEA